jgi:hypothetical protein
MSNLPQLFAQLVTDGQLVPWLHRCVTSRSGCTATPTGSSSTATAWASRRRSSGSTRRWCRGRPARDARLALQRPRGPAREPRPHPAVRPPGRKCGLSPIAAYAQTLGIGLQAQTYASDWFAAGGFPPGTFKNSEKSVAQDEAEQIKARVVTAIRTHAPLVYGADWDYNAITCLPRRRSSSRR